MNNSKITKVTNNYSEIMQKYWRNKIKNFNYL